MSLVRDELLAVLRCPVTRSSLVLHNDELVSTVDGPDGHRLRYGIEDGIVLLLRPEQLPAASEAGSDQHDGGTAVSGPAASAAAGPDALLRTDRPDAS